MYQEKGESTAIENLPLNSNISLSITNQRHGN